MLPIILLIPLFLSIVGVYADTLQKKDNHSKYKIAIIGGGISGSFLSKYLVDYDVHCSLDITIFDPWIPKSRNNDTRNSDEIYDLSSGQGSRVSSWTFPDGRTVELGASVIYEGNRLVNEMIDGDPNLIKIPAYSTGSFNTTDDIIKHDEFGILHSRSAPWILNLSNMTSEEMKRTLLWRYNLDLYRMNKATQNALSSFQLIYDILDSNHEASFLRSPNDVWRAVGLSHAASVSFDEYLDDIGVSSQLSWWRKLLSEQGLLREELLTAINLNNNHQTNKEMTGLAALVNFVALTGKLFAIDGGNEKLIHSAFQQAQSAHESKCAGTMNYNKESIKRIQKKIGTVISDYEAGFEVFDVEGKALGRYDIVVLAAPFQMSGINFLCKGSLFDASVLHDMPLNGLVDAESSNANDHGHRIALGGNHPHSLKTPYTQVVTTIVIDGELDSSYVNVHNNDIPTSILMTEAGKEEFKGIVTISKLGGLLYKVFSSEELSEEIIKTIFGENATIGKVKVWGGQRGGATPAFKGGGKNSFSSQFVLYDGGHGMSAYSNGTAVYYTNAMESAVSAIEISAIGAKFVSKHIARKLNFVVTNEVFKDEL